VAIDGVVPVIHPKPKLRWTSAGQVAGSGGCNAFVGKTIVGSDSVRFGALAATGKACMTAPTGQEDLFFKAIETTRKARLENEELLLLNESGETLARLVKAN
jgi:heat shock protein HslJ